MDYNTYEAQKELVERIRNGDSEASELLYKQVEKLIGSHASAAYHSSGTVYNIPYEDIFQEGVLGYLEAIERYDASYQVKFSSFASYYIKKYCYEKIDQESGMSFRVRRNKGKIHQMQELKMTSAEIQKELGLTDAQFKNLNSIPVLVNIDAPVEGINGSTTTIADLLLTDDTDSYREIELEETFALFHDALNKCLTEVERVCLLCPTGAFGYPCKTKESILKEYGFSSVKFNNTRLWAMRKLRSFVAKNSLTYYDFVG